MSGFDPLICTYKSEPIYNHKAINLIFRTYVIYHSIHHLCLDGLWVGSGAQYGHALLCLGGLEVGKVIQYIILSLYSWISGVAPRKSRHVILDLELIYLFVSGFDPLICTYKSEPIYNHKAINLSLIHI